MNGNPAKQEILNNAKEKLKAQETLTEVEKIVLREHLTWIRAKFSELYLKSKQDTLTAVEYDRMCRFKDEIDEIFEYSGGSNDTERTE